MPAGEVLTQWDKLQKETADDNVTVKDQIIDFLTTGSMPETNVDRWVNANEINTEELEFIGKKMASSVVWLAKQGVPINQAAMAMFSAGFQLGFNVANARIGADL